MNDMLEVGAVLEAGVGGGGEEGRGVLILSPSSWCGWESPACPSLSTSAPPCTGLSRQVGHTPLGEGTRAELGLRVPGEEPGVPMSIVPSAPHALMVTPH